MKKTWRDLKLLVIKVKVVQWVLKKVFEFHNQNCAELSSI